MMRITNVNANPRIANKRADLVFPDLSYKVTGAFFEVHNEHGRFCNEKQYADSLEKYFQKLGIPYEREKILQPSFDGEVKGRNRLDFIVDDKIIIEIKAKRFLNREDYYQTRRYLEACNKKLGLVVNFRDRYLRPKRILNSATH